MKYTREFLLFTGFLISACSEPPDLQMAELQRYYAQKGEGISPAVKKPEKPNTRQGTIPYLSTTNVPAPLSTTPPPLSTTNAPPPLSTTNAPPPLSATNALPPLSATNALPPLSATNALPPLSATNAPPPLSATNAPPR